MNRNLLWKCTACFAVILALICTFQQPLNTHYSNSYMAKDNWTISNNYSEEQQEITLPLKIDQAKPNEAMILTTELKRFNSRFDCPSILIQTDHQYVDLFFDGKLTYSNHDASFSTIDFPGSGYHVIRLPSDVETTTVEVHLSSPYSTYSGIIHPIMIGGKSDLIYCAIEMNLTSTMLGIVLLFFGAVLAISFMIMRYYQHNYTNFCYFGLYVFSLGLYTLCNTNLIQFFYNNPIFVDTLQHLTFFITIMFLSAFIYKSANESHPQLLKKFNRLFTFCIIVFTTVNFLWNISFHQLYLLYLVPLGIYLVYLIYYCFTSTSRMDSKNILFNRANTFLAIAILINLSVELVDKTKLSSFFYASSVCIYIFLIMVYIWISLVENNNNKIRIEMLTQMAYVDHLTKTKNRAAFAERLNELNRSLDQNSNICIGIFDLNNLKITNDTYGHHWGDELIKKHAQLLSELYADLGDVYRIGGDEIAVISINQDCVHLHHLAHDRNAINLLVNDETVISSTASFGFTEYNYETDSCLQDTYTRADKKMYQRKHSNK